MGKPAPIRIVTKTSGLAPTVEFLETTLGLPYVAPGTPSLAVSLDDDARVLATVKELARILQSPIDVGARDTHGRMKPTGLLHDPRGDRLAQQILAFLHDVCRKQGAPLVRKWPWRDAKPFGVALSHDVDLHRKWRGKTVISYAVRRRDFRGVGARVRGTPDPWWTYDTILDLERRAGTRSTFFFAAGGRHVEDPTYRIEDPKMAATAKDISRRGWEIGLHGSYRASENDRLLGEEKRRFERATGIAVDTYRQHYLRFHADSPQRILGAGFRYDSSLGTEYSLGFLGGISVPYVLGGLLELPLSLMDTCFQPTSDVNLAYGTEAERSEAIRDVLGKVREVRGLAIVDWHQNSFGEEDHPGFRRLYETILRESEGADRGGVREIGRWWETRRDARLHVDGDRWRIDGTNLPAGFTIAVAGGTLRTETPVTETRERDGTLYSLANPGPWEFRVL